LLAPNGHLFLMVPAYQFLFSVDDVAVGHYRRYTISTLSRALERFGFCAKFASYIFAPLPPIEFLLRTAPSKFGLRRGHDFERDAAEHAPGGVTARIMDRMLAAEVKRIQAAQSLPFGGSCICVARKSTNGDARRDGVVAGPFALKDLDNRPNPGCIPDAYL
jgi:hypothetical protein